MKFIRIFLHSLSYTFNTLIRKIFKSIAVVICVATFAILICVMDYTIQKQGNLLLDMYEQYKFNIVVLDKFAENKEDLEINNKYASIFMQEDSKLWGLIDEVVIRSNGEESADVYLQDDTFIDTLNVVGITYIPEQYEFGVTVEMAEGYSKDIFMGDESVCIVPQNVSQIGGNVCIKQGPDIEPLIYKVVGTYVPQEVGYDEEEANFIFCPYLNYDQHLASTKNNIYRLECRIIDAQKVTEIENYLLKYFIAPSMAGVTPSGYNELKLFYEYSFIIPKGNLEEVIDPIKADIKKLKIVEPFIFSFSIAIGFIISMLSIRNRKAEFAVMRSLGASGFYVFFESFMEQFILCMVGTGIGSIAAYFAYGNLSGSQINKILIFTACYMLGAVIEAISIARVKVMKIMKANE